MDRRKFFGLAAAGVGLVAIGGLESCEGINEIFHIKDCIKTYNEKYPNLKDKIEEQKLWFNTYVQSPIYRELLTTEVRFNLEKSSLSVSEEDVEEAVDRELLKRQQHIKDVLIFINHNVTRGNERAYSTTVSTSFVREQQLEPVGGVVPDTELRFEAIIINELELWQTEGSMDHAIFICHELHHASITRGVTKIMDTLFKDELKEVEFLPGNSFKTEYILDTAENMARFIEARKALYDLGKINAFTEKFAVKHIKYLKKYYKDIFPDGSAAYILFGDEVTRTQISDEKLLNIMNSFADVSVDGNPNSRMS